MQTTTPKKSQTVELGRYVTTRGEERILVGRRGFDQVVRVYDLPMPSDRLRGRSFFVEAGFESMRELAALRRDYLDQAERLGEVPMSRRTIRRLIDADRLSEAIS